MSAFRSIMALVLGHLPSSDPEGAAEVVAGHPRPPRLESLAMLMTPVKVILSNGEGDEIDLGVFNQGVVFEHLPNIRTTIIECVATSASIAVIDRGRGIMVDQSRPDYNGYFYKQMFVQTVEDPHLPTLIADMDRICKRGDS